MCVLVAGRLAVFMVVRVVVVVLVIVSGMIVIVRVHDPVVGVFVAVDFVIVVVIVIVVAVVVPVGRPIGVRMRVRMFGFHATSVRRGALTYRPLRRAPFRRGCGRCWRASNRRPNQRAIRRAR